jgi:hypothetical protein
MVSVQRALTGASVFSIQKCDPAPFYLFDEVSLESSRLISH